MTSKSMPIKNIAKQFSDKICQEFFKDKTTINGNEILGLTEFKQLNLFTLKNIFEKWSAEFNANKSALFDYEHPEVKKAISEYMNVLSRHISISEVNFNEILATSCEETLLLYTDPKEYFTKTFKNQPDFKLKSSWILEYGKFYHSYSGALRSLNEKILDDFIFSNDAINIMHEIISKQGLEIHDADVVEIKKIAGFESKSPELKNTISDPNQSFFDSIEAYKQQFDSPKLHVNTEPIARNEPAPLPTKTVTITEPETLSINESALSTQIADLNSNIKSDNIRSSISLNQKYLFINHLFNGEIDAFDKTINALESCESISQARDQVLKPFMESNKWNISSVEVEEFFEILKRRYNK